MSVKVTSLALAMSLTATLLSASGLQERGSVRTKILGFSLYDATLYTPEGQQLEWEGPFELHLTYLRNFSGRQLTNATLDELERMEGSRPDQTSLVDKLGRCFPDVRPGDTIRARAESPNQVTLTWNGTSPCSVYHRDATRRFLGIWLSDNSRNPRQSALLRGEK